MQQPSRLMLRLTRNAAAFAAARPTFKLLFKPLWNPGRDAARR